MSEAAFRDLRRLADCFSACPRAAQQIERIVQRLGATAVPFLGRQLRSGDADRRDAARDALEAIAAQSGAHRARVTAELLAITGSRSNDDRDDGAKVVALGLLGELGEHADVQFADPDAIRVRSAIALAGHLETPADVAGAADTMIHELTADDIAEMVEVMAAAEPAGAHRLAVELRGRLDLPVETRPRIELLVQTLALRAEPAAPALAEPAAADVAVLVDAAARLVVIASCKHAITPASLPGDSRWRRWAVLIGASGRIDDCLHEEDAGPDGDTAQLVETLCADGYRIANRELAAARDVVARAARLTAEATRALPAGYYLGRDLLGLADAHLGERGAADPAAATLARAIELVAAGEHASAQPLLDRCDPDHPDAAAALAASLLATGRADAAVAALRALDRALAVEPDWPLHHWNRAAALHQLGDMRGACQALRRFVETSAQPTGLHADPDQPRRLARAEQLIAALTRLGQGFFAATDSA